MTEILSLLGTSVGLGVGAGVNAYATLLVFGLFARLSPGWFPGDTAQVFASTPVLITLAVLYCIEFIADKVPAVDHVWDVVHTFVRPAAGAAVAFAAANSEIPRHIAIMAAAIAGGAALTSHVSKASLRAASTVTTGGTANPILSLVEDLFAIVQAIFAVLLPYIVLVFSVFLLIGIMIWAIRRRRRLDALPD